MKTPQTDDIARGNHVIPTEWAEQLERERDEALSQIVQAECRAERFCQERDEAREAFVIATDQMVVAQCTVRKLNTERDEAIKERDKIQTELEMWRDGNIMHQIHSDELEKVERERDEAREAWYQMQSSFERSRDEVERVIRERDEAREALMRIEDLFLDGTDIYADREKMGLIARAALEEVK